MGWGISIDVDEDGHVYCSDANWDTTSQDYVTPGDCVYPPSSREFIRDYMDSQYHDVIDMARDEGSAELACEECRSAFESAKYSYDDLDEEEQTRLHSEWLEQAQRELKGIVVDEEATALAQKRIEELKTQIDNLKTELYENQRIIRPSQRKVSLEKQIAQELDCWE